MSILDFFPPGKTPRPEQREFLLSLEAAWKDNDIFVANCPTAFGKTEIAYTIGVWQRRKAFLLEPENALVSQTEKRYHKIVSLYRKDTYNCLAPMVHNPDCRCEYTRQKERTEKATFAVMNYHSCIYNRLHRPVMIIDEAHRVIDTLRSFAEIKLRRADYDFPARFNPRHEFDLVGDWLDWCVRYLKDNIDAKLDNAVMKMRTVGDDHIVVHTHDEVSVEPISIVRMGFKIWPKSVEKLVFLSATTGAMDIKELALDNKRVWYADCPSPIPAKNRPLVYSPRFNLARACLPTALPLLAQEIDGLLAKHPEKGMIHLPYHIAREMSLVLDNPRLIFHTKFNKAQRLDEFRNGTNGEVLVASGMYEGLDLPYDAARWQLIGKIPFASLGDPVVAEHAKADPIWYKWDTIRKVLQAYGRIVRAPDDYGVTYIFDTSFEILWKSGFNLFPKFVRDAYRKVPK